MYYVTKSASLRVAATHASVIVKTQPPRGRNGPDWARIAEALRAVAREIETEAPAEITDI